MEPVAACEYTPASKGTTLLALAHGKGPRATPVPFEMPLRHLSANQSPTMEPVAACEYTPASKGTTLLVLAHGSGTPATPVPFEMPRGVSVWTYNRGRTAMWSPEIKQIADEMDKTGVVPRRAGSYVGRPHWSRWQITQ